MGWGSGGSGVGVEIHFSSSIPRVYIGHSPSRVEQAVSEWRASLFRDRSLLMGRGEGGYKTG